MKSVTKKSTCPNFLRDGQLFIYDPKKKADMFSNYFQSVFSKDPATFLQQESIRRSLYGLFGIELSISELYEVLINTQPNKACGPDKLPRKILYEVAVEISPALTKLFNQSLLYGQFPRHWKWQI